MANILTMQMLKLYAPSLANRGESGEPKTVTVGLSTRSRISSQCIKKAVRNYVAYNSIRSAHLYELVEKMLLELVADGTITEEELPAIGNIACMALNCSWDKLNKESDSKDEKGNTVVQATPEEITTVVRASIEAARALAAETAKTTEKSEEVEETEEQEGDDKKKKKGKSKPKLSPKAKKIIDEALNNVRISVDKALFGVMATDGELGSVDAAVRIGNLYSIDEYIPESDYITATYSAGTVKSGDPFFGSFEAFNAEQGGSARAETLANRWEYSNTMYAKTEVDIDILRKNLSESIVGKKMSIPQEVITGEMRDAVIDYINALIDVTPSANQSNLLTNSFPAICYFESIKGGTEFFADPYFQKVIKSGESKSVSAQGIEKFLDYAQSKKRIRGDGRRYVLLDDMYAEYEDAFEMAGVTVLHSMDELNNALKEEIERLDA